MKNQKSILVILLCLVVGVSCNDDAPSYKKLDELSPYVQQFISMHMNPNVSLQETNAVQRDQFRNLMEQRASINGRIKGDSTVGDSTDYDPWQWVTCATVTRTQDDLGGETTIVDYGDGCEEGSPYWKTWRYGKMSYYFRNGNTTTGDVTNYTYISKANYDNYGGRYIGSTDTVEWVFDGASYYSGSGHYNSATNTYGGEYTSEDSTEYVYDGQSTSYRGACKSTFDHTKWIVSESDYEYSNNDNYYHATVLSPLVWSYTCQNGFTDRVTQSIVNSPYIFTYVSGKEIIIYSQNGVDGSFSIDYGNGECDNIIYITENGVTAKVDVGEQIHVHQMD